MTGLHGFGPRPARLPLRRGAVDPTDAAGLAAVAELIGDTPMPPVEENAAEPFVGITTEGTPVPGLFPLVPEGVPTGRAAAAARDYLATLTPTQRSAAVLPLDAPEWRLWTNAFLVFPEHGLLLQELSDERRRAGLAMIEASLGGPGFRRVRRAMQLNGELGELVGGYADTLTEFCYWLTVFGDPDPDWPWGWQLQGHHVDLHCLFVGDQVVLTPTFLGVEFGGETVFAEHRRRALELMTSLGACQRDRALLYGSMLAPDLPPELAGPVDGRHRAGAGRDNLVLPYAGLRGDDLSPGQRELLVALTAPYLDTLPAGVREVREEQVRRHVDQTHLAWIGGVGEADPFYYRLHGPVLLVEYDNHPGIFLDNDEPEPFHVHTIVRTPNGGDYGRSLLRQHYEAHEHAHRH